MSKIFEAASSLKADFWIHFGFKASERNQGIDKANPVCKQCQVSLPSTGDTTNLHFYMQSHCIVLCQIVLNCIKVCIVSRPVYLGTYLISKFLKIPSPISRPH